MTAGEAELEATEYMLGLEALGNGLDRKARQIFDRAQVRDIRPPLMKQQTMLRRVMHLTEAGRDALDPEFLAVDAKVAKLEADIIQGWERCLEQLKTLWLTDGRALEELSP